MSERIGVVGAGTIGRGVAQALAEKDIDVVLVDTSGEQLRCATRQIGSDLRTQSLVSGVRRTEPDEVVLRRISCHVDLTALASVGFVIENVTENWDVKSALYREMDRICAPDVVFAVNTSAISITRLAAVTDRPDRILGMHFMNPVPLMRMVEMIRGHHTSARTMSVATRLLDRLGKDAVVVDDLPGFVTNRVLMLTINEAVFCVQDGVAAALDVDRIFKGCFGHRMGPLETADLIGLDTILNSITVLYDSFNDSKYRPAPLLRRMVDAGLLGRKTGQGFYDYRIDTDGERA